MVAMASTLPNSKSPASLLQYQSNFCCNSSGGNTESTELLRINAAVLDCSAASIEPSAAAMSAHIAMLPLANSLFLNWPAFVVSCVFISLVLALSESQNAICDLPAGWCPTWAKSLALGQRTHRAQGSGEPDIQSMELRNDQIQTVGRDQQRYAQAGVAGHRRNERRCPTLAPLGRRQRHDPECEQANDGDRGNNGDNGDECQRTPVDDHVVDPAGGAGRDVGGAPGVGGGIEPRVITIGPMSGLIVLVTVLRLRGSSSRTAA